MAPENGPPPKIMRFATFEVDLQARELRKSGLKLKLQGQPLEVLAMLLEKPGELVSRERLRERLWPTDTFVDFDHGVNTAINRLREALGDSADNPRFIETLPRRGYRFLASVESSAPVAQALPVGSGVPEVPPVGPAVIHEEKAIAVAPFVFLTAMEDKESLSLGFADALITTLGQLEDLRVPPTAAILRYAAGTDALQIGRELRVRYVLQGNIQKIGVHWRVSIQLTDTQLRQIVLSEKHDFNLSDVFEVQDQIGKQVAESLRHRFHSIRTSRDRYSSDPQAYMDYLRGLNASYSATAEGLDQAISSLSSAVQRDPNFSLAHAMLAHTSAARYFSHEGRYKSLQLAEKHCERALQLDPDLPEAIMARAYILWTPHRNFRHLEAIADLKKAISMQPNLDHAYNRLGSILAHIGQIPPALEAHKAAQRVNPQNLGYYNISLAYIWGGRYQEAAETIEAFRQLNPGNKYCLWLRPQPPLLMGNLEEAAKFATEAVNAYPDEPRHVSLLGLVQAHLGQTDLAKQAVATACASPLSFGHTHHTHYQIACIYAVLGDRQSAMHWLERAVETGFPCWPFFLHDTSLDNLRGQTEFEDLIASLQSEFPCELVAGAPRN